MKISARTDYACKAILELALNWPSTNPVQIATIATNQDIPIKFLTQILLNLKQLGYVQSTRGKKGGYILSKAPKEIKLSNLISEFENASFNEFETHPIGAGQNIMTTVWNEVDNMVYKSLNKFNFEVISNKHKRTENIG